MNPPHAWARSNLGERQLLPQLISAEGRSHWSATPSVKRLFLFFPVKERKVA